MPTTKKDSHRTTKNGGRQLFLGIRGVVEGYSRRTLALIIVGNLVLAAGIIGGVWYYYRQHHKPKVVINQEDGNYRRIQSIKAGPVPKDPLDQIIYYSQLAQNYTALKQNDDALQNFLKAQDVAEKNNLADSYDFNRAIGDAYLAKGDKKKAKEYYNKEIQHLQAYQKDHPDNTDNQKLIDELQAQVQKL